MEFDPFGVDYFERPHVAYEWMRANEPVYYSERYDFYALTRYDDVQAAFKDPATYRSRYGVMLTDMANPDFDGHRDMPGIFSMYDPPLHDSFRTTVNPLFRGPSFAALENEAQRLIDERIDELSGAGEFDYVQDFAEPIPAGLVFAAMGLPRSDWAELQEAAKTFMSAGDVDHPMADRGALEAGEKVAGYLATFAQARRDNPQPDMISALARTTLRDGDTDRPLTVAEIAGIASLFVYAGWETTTSLIATTAVQLAAHPGERKRVAAAPELIPTAIDEAARLDPPAQYLGRTTGRAVTVRGVEIPHEGNVVLLIGSANRDEDVFENAAEFSLDRPRRSIMTFGFGLHACVGARLGRIQARLATRSVLDRWPDLEVDETSLRRRRNVVTSGYNNVRVRVRP